AYVKGGNVVVHELKTNRTKALTKGATATRFFGLAEFVADEELDRHAGFWWSKDGAKLLILEVDESGVAVKVRPQIFADHTEMVSQRYPAAGEANAKVTAHVVDVKTGKDLRVVVPKSTEYIARGGFFADGAPWLQVLDRAQQALTLLEVDGRTGGTRAITVETDAAWVETHDDLRELKTGNGDNALLWSSETSGMKQLVRLDRKPGTRAPLTTTTEPVHEVVCVDAGSGRIVYGAYADRGRAQHIFVREPDGSARALTTGSVSVNASADDNCQHLLLTTSSWGVPPTTTMVSVADGRVLGTIGGDAGPDPLLAASMPGKPVFLDVTAADGTTKLNGLWLPPAPTHAPASTLATAKAATTATKTGSIPVIAYAYGGPTGQVVAHRWAKLTPLFTHWQQLGFGVFLVDTRGMAGRDRAFTRAHKNAFGVVEVDDLKAALRQLPRLVPGVDPARIGFFGWSYGGYLAVRSVLDGDTPVAAAAAVAPVTDWRLYDTAYTERYLGMPPATSTASSSTNDAWATSNLVTKATSLSRPLLLVHGTADDNVLFEHTLQLVGALENEGKVFDLAIYPGKAHGIAGKSSQLHLHKTLTAFFVDELRP
ncbi:MAG TPA: DPP IV N-terminal domain-containing protein, partial [Myxococcota bacterium]